MKKYGEVITFENNIARVRIYKENAYGSYPTSLTLTAKTSLHLTVGEMVEADINFLLLFLSALPGYIFPFVVFFSVFFSAMHLIGNFLVADCFALLSLPIVFYLAHKAQRLPINSFIQICKLEPVKQFKLQKWSVTQ